MLPFKPTATPVSIKFIALSFITIVLTGFFVLIVYSWQIGMFAEIAAFHDESSIAENLSLRLTAYQSTAQSALTTDYQSGKIINTALSQYFDIGIVQYKNGKFTSLNFNDSKFKNLVSLTGKDSSFYTTKVIVDTGSNILDMIYQGSDGGYEIGAVDLTGSTITPIINDPTYTTYLLSSDKSIINSNTRNIDTSFLKHIQFNANTFSQIKIGNLHREAFTYLPLPSYSLGIGLLSGPFTDTIIAYTNSYAGYISLLGVVIFLSMIIIYSILVDIPLTKILTFFDDYYKGKVRTIVITSKDSFGKISENINTLISKLKDDYKRIDKADEIQDDFIFLSSHMLRTPLTSIRGYIDLLKDGNKDEKLTNFIINAEMSLSKLEQIEENILSISTEHNTIINAPKENILIQELMDQAYTETVELAKEKNLNFILDTSDFSNIKILANRKNMLRAIKNLIDNATRFRAGGGTIKLYGKVKTNTAIISVSDTGIGLTKDEVDQLFKKFSKISDTMEYNSDGLGIGLYVVKIIAEEYNGRVWVDSIKGSGSIFNIAIPTIE